jgi:hypothetical protein
MSFAFCQCEDPIRPLRTFRASAHKLSLKSQAVWTNSGGMAFLGFLCWIRHDS